MYLMYKTLGYMYRLAYLPNFVTHVAKLGNVK